MSDSELYRQYAAEYEKLASNASHEDKRERFTEMANIWTQAALRIDLGMPPPNLDDLPNLNLF
jgi:hypothetical protein